MEQIIKCFCACIVLHILIVVGSSFAEEWNLQNKEIFQDNVGDGEDVNNEGRMMPRNNNNSNSVQRHDEICQCMIGAKHKVG